MSSPTTLIDHHVDGVELDSRTHDGLTVELLWTRADNRTFVRVEDWKSIADPLTFEVPGPYAADAFEHPFAYLGYLADRR